jgi:hypothetical protein
MHLSTVHARAQAKRDQMVSELRIMRKHKVRMRVAAGTFTFCVFYTKCFFAGPLSHGLPDRSVRCSAATLTPPALLTESPCCLQCPWLVTLFNAFYEEATVSMVLEFMNGGARYAYDRRSC